MRPALCPQSLNEHYRAPLSGMRTERLASFAVARVVSTRTLPAEPQSFDNGLSGIASLSLVIAGGGRKSLPPNHAERGCSSCHPNWPNGCGGLLLSGKPLPLRCVGWSTGKNFAAKSSQL